MIVSIGAPAPKALSANEKRVYQLLKEGKAPFEIAKKLHLPMGSVSDFKYNVHDVPPDTIVNIISSIRSKGYEIPETEKEEKPMARITEEMKREMITLRNSGMKVNRIAERFGVDKSSVYNVIKAYSDHGESAFTAQNTDEEPESLTCEAETEKEPETAATESGSEQESCEHIPADIIPETEENVKPESENAEPLIPESVVEACRARIDDLRKQIAAEQAVIDERERQIVEIKEFLEFSYGVIYNLEKQIAEIKEFLELARIANPVGGTI